MKLNSLLPNVAKMEVVHPTMGETGVFLFLIGQDTKAFRDKAKTIAKGMVGKNSKDVDLDKLEEQNTDLASTCIVGWEGLEDDNGEPLQYTPAEALKLMNNPELTFIREQVESFIAERKNFFRPAGE